MGGHSLLAMRVLSRVRTTFNTSLTMRDIFDTPTIAGLAAIIAQRDGLSANGSSSRRQSTPTGSVKELAVNGYGASGREVDAVSNPIQEK